MAEKMGQGGLKRMGDRDQIRGQKELQGLVLDTNLCTGCGACMGLCPYFRSYKGKTVTLFPCTLTQGRCFAYCPKVEVDLDNLSEKFFGRPYDGSPLGSYQTVMISRAHNEVGGAAFQAGGTVSAIIYFALKKGYLDGAVLTDRDGLLPVPRFITNPDEVFSCASSKYSATPTLSALNQGIRDGFTQIGVVATPCQVLSTLLMRSNPLDDKTFVDPTGLVIGLFCTWALDFRPFEKFVSDRVDIKSITKVDIPPPPSDLMEIYLGGDQKIEIPLEEIRQLVPEGCSYCPDMTAEFSDISVGVLEGHPDMNTLIIRTERGREIVEEAIKEGYLVVADIPKKNLEHLQSAAGNKKRRAVIKGREAGIINTGDKSSYLRLSAGVLEKITS
ncbi:MAG: Coenzyme F420 hydrogenase/dehydrogenase, beta subunit C-terminal domain [Desulfobacteraceae bacterium]|nr:Coenzyme F420 hydrogenase/dehydrogenase, beta subunit C-terminal domain [Desulfobacteraceae bacterium]